MPTNKSNQTEHEKLSALEFDPEERAAADTSWVDPNQWENREGAEGTPGTEEALTPTNTKGTPGEAEPE